MQVGPCDNFPRRPGCGEDALSAAVSTADYLSGYADAQADTGRDD
jgi:hypothetical protein